MGHVAGLLLAAGAGRRMGRPKALVDGWLAGAVAALAGCDPTYVVLGAAVDEARPLVPAGVRVVVAEDWPEGMGASLRAGLAAVAADPGDLDAVVVTLVDLPDVGRAVLDRLLAQEPGSATLARATYDGRPGHPVVLGRDHWPGVLALASGDRGARDYLAGREVITVECGDLATGRDVDGPGPPSPL